MTSLTVTYTDGSKCIYPSVSSAETGVAEVIAGCGFAVGVSRITNQDGTKEFSNTWSVQIREA